MCTLRTGFRNPFRVKVLPDDSVYVSDTGSGIEIGERLTHLIICKSLLRSSAAAYCILSVLAV